MPKSEVIQLNPHERMTVEQCVGYLQRNYGNLQDLIAGGVNADGQIVINSSAMSRAEAVFILLQALDHARGIDID